jgi:hypothetical protein
MVAGGNALIDWNPTLASGAGSYVLLFCSGAPDQIAPATKNEHAVQLGQLGHAGVVPRRLLRTTVYINDAGTLQSSVNGSAFANASSTFTPLSATSTVDIEVAGAGGAGGGAAICTSGQVSEGAGGDAGGYSRG